MKASHSTYNYLDGNTSRFLVMMNYTFLFDVFFFSFQQMSKSTFIKIKEKADVKQMVPDQPCATVVLSMRNDTGGLFKALKLFQVKKNIAVLSIKKLKYMQTEAYVAVV